LGRYALKKIYLIVIDGACYNTNTNTKMTGAQLYLGLFSEFGTAVLLSRGIRV